MAEESIQQEEQPNGADSTDWKAKARDWESRSKANKKALDAANAELDELREYRQRAEQAEREASELKAAKERDELLAKVSDETGIPRDLLHGDTEEELTSSASRINEYIQKRLEDSKPSSWRDSGAGRPKDAKDAKDAFSEFMEQNFS